ncbi:MAG TPA: hypothetical protein DDW27_16940 [Bacteroidales bacterium]|nr:hypothetical protein [Bacteroidales bacterium]
MMLKPEEADIWITWSVVFVCPVMVRYTSIAAWDRKDKNIKKIMNRFFKHVGFMDNRYFNFKYWQMELFKLTLSKRGLGMYSFHVKL